MTIAPSKATAWQSAELLRLAERVEGLTGSDREIDGLIACAIFKTISTDDDLIYRVPIRKDDECAAGTYWHVQRSGRSLQTAPKFTESLDAAVSLVPDGYAWSCGFSKHVPHNAQVWPISRSGFFESEVDSNRAIALAAAALRARAAAARGE